MSYLELPPARGQAPRRRPEVKCSHCGSMPWCYCASWCPQAFTPSGDPQSFQEPRRWLSDGGCRSCSARHGEMHTEDCPRSPAWASSKKTAPMHPETPEHAVAPLPAAPVAHSEPDRRVSLPDDAKARLEYPMADGLLDYFPNALAEVSRLSYAATQQHHPDQEMHWDRSKSTDHRNKIMRHLVDTGKLDDKGMRHSAMVAWRALALLQEEMERDLGLPPSRASRNRPY